MLSTQDVEQVKQIIREEFANRKSQERQVFEQHTQILDGKNIQVGKGTGTQIGTEAAQKIAFHGATPVVQAAHIDDPAAVAANLKTAVDAILVVLENKGFIATS